MRCGDLIVVRLGLLCAAREAVIGVGMSTVSAAHRSGERRPDDKTLPGGMDTARSTGNWARLQATTCTVALV